MKMEKITDNLEYLIQFKGHTAKALSMYRELACPDKPLAWAAHKAVSVALNAHLLEADAQRQQRQE